MFKLLALGPTRPTLLAELSGISGASVTSLVRTLEAKGLVSRRPAEADGRGVEIALTPAGRADQGRPGSPRDRESEWFAPLSRAERRRLTDCSAT